MSSTDTPTTYATTVSFMRALAERFFVIECQGYKDLEHRRPAMASRSSAKTLECRCTRCKYNNGGQCGYQGRVVINQNGECESRQDGYGRDPGPF